jgi:hypothetical protein
MTQNPTVKYLFLSHPSCNSKKLGYNLYTSTLLDKKEKYKNKSNKKEVAENILHGKKTGD